MPKTRQPAFDVSKFQPIGCPYSSFVSFWSRFSHVSLSRFSFLPEDFLRGPKVQVLLDCQSIHLVGCLLVYVRRLICCCNGWGGLRFLLKQRLRASVCSLPQAETR